MFYIPCFFRGKWRPNPGVILAEQMKLCVFVGARCYVLMGLEHVTGHIAPPDRSDSDRYCGPGIGNFLLFSIPLATPPSPRDERRRRHVG